MEEQREREILEIRSGFNAVAYSIGVFAVFLATVMAIGNIYGKTILSVLFIILIIRRQKKSVELGIENFFTIERVSPVDILKSAVLILGVFGLSILWINMCGGNNSGDDNRSMFAAIMVGSVLSPISEELGFRGLMQGRLAQAMSPMSAIIVQAIPFWFGHGISVVSFYTCMIGVVFGVIQKKTSNIFVVILGHALINSMWLIIYIIPEMILGSICFICIIPAIIIFIKWIREIKESSL